VSEPSDTRPGGIDAPLETVARYYDAWQNKQGDFSDVALADDFAFRGPVASFDTADGYRTMAAEAARAVTASRCAASSLMAMSSARSSTGRWRFPDSDG
jgi:ketosteroid isomerase-like protein